MGRQGRAADGGGGVAWRALSFFSSIPFQSRPPNHARFLMSAGPFLRQPRRFFGSATNCDVAARKCCRVRSLQVGESGRGLLAPACWGLWRVAWHVARGVRRGGVAARLTSLDMNSWAPSVKFFGYLTWHLMMRRYDSIWSSHSTAKGVSVRGRGCTTEREGAHRPEGRHEEMGVKGVRRRARGVGWGIITRGCVWGVSSPGRRRRRA